MVVISTHTQRAQGRIQTVRSDDAGPTDSVDMVLAETLLPHSFLGIKMFDSGGLPILAGAETGEFTVTLASDVSPALEAPTGSVQNAAALTQVDFAGPIRRVVVAVTSALSAGVDTWRVDIQSFLS